VRPRLLASRLGLTLLTLALLGALAGAPAQAAPARADVNVEELRQQIAQIRGLSFQSPTAVNQTSQDIMQRMVGRTFDGDDAALQTRSTQALLEVLGASVPGFDLGQFQRSRVSDQVATFYNHRDHTVYVVPGLVSGPAERLMLAHELTHALQDQSFDLARVLPDRPENADAALAAQALVQGDAMLTMRVWGRTFLRPEEKRALGDSPPSTADPLLDRAPSFVREQEMFPSGAGWEFAQRLYRDGGFEAVNKAFTAPPRSTEQILHPDLYAQKQRPVPVSMPALDTWLRGTWRTLRTDVLGELGLRLILEPSLGSSLADAAAAGWGGDTYAVLEDADGRRLVAIMTVWDIEMDAADFYNAFVSAVPLQYKDAQRRTINEPSRVRWSVPGYQVQVLKTGSSVRLVYAPDDATLEAVDALLG
jgi:hypothetical protein